MDRYMNTLPHISYWVISILVLEQYCIQLLQPLASQVAIWWLNMDKGKMNSVVFLDIRKDFDTVSHKILLR